MENLDETLDRLERDGFVWIENALSPEETEQVRQRVFYAKEQGWQEGLNAVGNMWFDTLLDREPEVFGPLVGHPSLAPILYAMMGRQCQLRSYRAHINPGPYLQEWHMDFYGYWNERRDATQHRVAVTPTSINTTFYFQDNRPGQGFLRFVRNGHLAEPPHLYPRLDHAAFEKWCYEQELVTLYPKAGDAIVFLSHIPHQGGKENDEMERCNVVCHYQVCPMHESVWYVSRPRPFKGSFPFQKPETIPAVAYGSRA
ncbi:MAG: phytanoyl-CoA dioxygenase family protein [candidate division Zixibacteria bacterium]|nr:phytanoyl-CoA dioxygenase family protein [candidate division Zixibacteria bacterium]